MMPHSTTTLPNPTMNKYSIWMGSNQDINAKEGTNEVANPGRVASNVLNIDDFATDDATHSANR